MDVLTENIYMNKVKNRNTYQLTLDDDFIVSDTKPDMDKIIRQRGEIIIDEYKVGKDKVDIRGRLKCDVLYITNNEERFLNSMTETIPFNESINTPGIVTDNSIVVRSELEDLAITIINSRKISVKGLITLYISQEEVFVQTAAVKIEGDVQENNDELELTRLVTCSKDIFRIKEEIQLQSTKKNIQDILYTDIHIINCNTRVLDEKISLKGDILIFILYMAEDGEYECIEKELPYSGELELSDAREDMIDEIDVDISRKDIVSKQDEDGEYRIIDLDITLDIGIKLYKEDKINVLKDVYSTKKWIKPKIDEVEYINLLMKNLTTFRINERIDIQESHRDIMQICNSIATIKIDDIQVVDKGISIEGIVETDILYISSDDKEPMNSLNAIIPYTHIIEVSGISEDSIYDIKPYIEQIQVTMLTGKELEVKIAVNLDTIVFDKKRECLIVDVEEREFTKKEKDDLCSMVGYRVKEGDTLWDIAKKYFTTVDMLKEINKIVDNDIKTGDKLLIVKGNLV